MTKSEAEKMFYDEGKTLSEMRKYFGCKSVITAAKRLRELGIETNRNKLKKQNTMMGMSDEEFKEYLKEQYKTKSMGEIGKEIGVSAAAVRKYFVKFGMERRGNTEFMHDPTKTPNWNGGIHVKSTGYVEVYAPDHPRANGRPYIYQHILVMEKHIGRYLEKDEVVHHIDGNKSNNDISNLRLMTNREHVMMHGNIGKRKKGGGEPNEK